MPRVLLLFEYSSVNGGERSILATAEEVRRAGIQIEAVAPGAGPLAEELVKRKIRHWPLAISAGQQRPLADLRADLLSLLETTQPDLIHANSLAMARISGPLANKLAMPSIGHLRDILRLNRAAISDINCHTRLLAVSHATRDYHVAAGLDAAKVDTLYNGVDVSEFQPRTKTRFLHRELGLPHDAIPLGAIGQIGLRKGFDVWLRAAAELAPRHPELHFLIVGQRFSQKEESRRFEADLHESSQRPALAGRVHFLGRRKDIAQILTELALLVHPARQEPLGRVLLEAAACGLPIVATNVGGTAEILGGESPAGCLVPADDVSLLVQVVEELLADGERRRDLGLRARQRVEQRFDHRRAAAGLVQHYRAVLANANNS